MRFIRFRGRIGCRVLRMMCTTAAVPGQAVCKGVVNFSKRAVITTRMKLMRCRQHSKLQHSNEDHKGSARVVMCFGHRSSLTLRVRPVGLVYGQTIVG